MQGTISAPARVAVFGSNGFPVVTIVATDPLASETGDTGTFTLYRSGNTNAPLNVFCTIGGTASNGVDYATLSNFIPIPAGATSAQVIVKPIDDMLVEPNQTVILHLAQSPLMSPVNYAIGTPDTATVVIVEDNDIPPTNPPVVSIIATDPIAIEGTNCFCFVPPTTVFTNYCSGTNTATFLVRRIGDTNVDLTVGYSIGGTASNGVDYVSIPGTVTIPAGKRFALITIVPLEDVDAAVRPFETVVLALQPPPPPPSNSPPPYIVGWPARAAALILEECDTPLPVAGLLPDKCFHACWPGANGLNYCLEVSSDLVNWTPVCTNTVVKGAVHFVDPESCEIPVRYYRVVPATGPPTY
jgi:hypothetical protein